MGKVINTTTGNLQRYSKDTLKEIKSLVADITTQIEFDATRDAPMSSGGTKFISIDKKFSDNGYTGEVGVMGENDLAAYFEFGTGLSAGDILAPYPQWIKDIARKFFVTGQGTLKGKPYLYPNVLKGIPVFQRELKQLVDKDIKDNG
ncbi:MAG: hypothetical protein PHU69_13455 [Fermentimonas sp.]|nr:hypothetical protein [Fermentimonas sp.]